MARVDHGARVVGLALATVFVRASTDSETSGHPAAPRVGNRLVAGLVLAAESSAHSSARTASRRLGTLRDT